MTTERRIQVIGGSGLAAAIWECGGCHAESGTLTSVQMGTNQPALFCASCIARLEGQIAGKPELAAQIAFTPYSSNGLSAV